MSRSYSVLQGIESLLSCILSLCDLAKLLDFNDLHESLLFGVDINLSIPSESDSKPE